MTALSTFAPFIRGCTYDGEKGSFVVPVPAGADIEALRRKPRTVSTGGGTGRQEMEAGIVSTLREYREKSGDVPEVLILDGLGAFGLGESYEAARSAAAGGTFPRPETAEGEESAREHAGYDRNRVVKNKIALVTGGAQGFGEGLARELAAAGALVCIADLNIEGAEKLAAEMNAAYKRTAALPLEVNVSDEESVREMFEAAAAETGGIDLCISNAGVLKAGSVKEMALKDFRFVTDVNYTGYFLCTKYASTVMADQARGARESGRGTYYTDIIQINSKSGLEGSNKNGAYAGGKFGGIGLTQSFAKELITDNIKVNSICPGNFFDGPLWADPDRGLFVQYLRAGKVPGATTIADVKRFYEAKVPMDRGCTVQDVVKAVYYIVEQKYETGQAVPVTGGQIMLK
jgi:sorbitol-6-phosphate 2-dehydrogenase